MAVPRPSYVERYKAKLRVDWKQWDRRSTLQVMGDTTWETGDGDSDDEDEGEAESGAGAPAASAAKRSVAGPPPAVVAVRGASFAGSQKERKLSFSSSLQKERKLSVSASWTRSKDSSSTSSGTMQGSRISEEDLSSGDWRPETLEKQSAPGASGKIELVHTCCDGRRVATTVPCGPELPARACVHFNRDPKKTVKALLAGDAELCAPPEGAAHTHEELARWMLTANKLSKNRIGDYLGRSDDDAVKLLGCFLQPLDFADFTFDEALRFFLSLFRLPGEAQQIDRIMQRFANRYYDAHPDKFRVADTAYILAFSLIMLNTDAHSDQIEHKMSLSQFLSNNRGIDEGEDLDKDMMTMLYHSIVKNEIRMEQREFISSVKEGWLLKQGGRVKTWKKRYTILSGNVLYYFKSPKDRAPLGFVPLEGIEVTVRSDGRSFEVRSIIHGEDLKSVRMEDSDGGKGGGCCGCCGGGGGAKKGGFKQGHHKAFVFRTPSEAESVDEWVQAVRSHAVAHQVREVTRSGSSAEELARPTVSFFRSKAVKKAKKRSWLKPASGNAEPLPSVDE